MNSIITLPKFLDLMALTSGRGHRFADKFMSEFTALITEALAADGVVRIKGLGQFKRVTVASKLKIEFVPDRELADFINAPFLFFEPTELADSVTNDMLWPQNDNPTNPEDASAQEDNLALNDKPTQEDTFTLQDTLLQRDNEPVHKFDLSKDSPLDPDGDFDKAFENSTLGINEVTEVNISEEIGSLNDSFDEKESFGSDSAEDTPTTDNTSTTDFGFDPFSGSWDDHGSGRGEKVDSSFPGAPLPGHNDDIDDIDAILDSGIGEYVPHPRASERPSFNTSRDHSDSRRPTGPSHSINQWDTTDSRRDAIDEIEPTDRRETSAPHGIDRIPTIPPASASVVDDELDNLDAVLRGMGDSGLSAQSRPKAQTPPNQYAQVQRPQYPAPGVDASDNREVSAFPNPLAYRDTDKADVTSTPLPDDRSSTSAKPKAKAYGDDKVSNSRNVTSNSRNASSHAYDKYDDEDKPFPWFWIALMFIVGLGIGFAIGVSCHDIIFPPLAYEDTDVVDVVDNDASSVKFESYGKDDSQEVKILNPEEEYAKEEVKPYETDPTPATKAPQTEPQQRTQPQAQPTSQYQPKPEVKSDQNKPTPNTDENSIVGKEKNIIKNEPLTVSTPKTNGNATVNTPPANTNTSGATVYDTITSDCLLTDLAKKHYGNTAYWVYIYQENSDIISNPNNLRDGLRVRIPPKSKYDVSSNEEENIAAAKNKGRELFAKFR